MKRLAAALLLVALGIGGASAASDPTAEHKRVYAEVNDNLAGMEKQAFELDMPGAPVPAEVTAWSDDGDVRKLRVVYPGDHGDTTDEFYFEANDAGGQLLFVYESVVTQAIDGSNASTSENRYYFDGGRLFLWLDGDRRKVTPGSDAFVRAEQDLIETSDAALAELSGKGGSSGQGAAPVAGDAQQLTGVFTGLEVGDYTYLKLDAGGEERSFMILDTDDAIEALLADPSAYEGRKLTITWQTSEQDIPEAGGKIEVDQLLSVSLPN